MDNGNRMTFEHVIDTNNRKLASVKITEYPDSGNANPEPVSESNADNFEGFLSPQFIVSSMYTCLFSRS